MAEPTSRLPARIKPLLVWAVVGLVLICFASMNWKSVYSQLTGSTRSVASESQPTDSSAPLLPQWEVGPDGATALRLPEAVIRSMRLSSEPAVASTGDFSLRLTGQLMLDPSRLVHVNTRFDGEVMRIEESMTGESKKAGTLRVGDRVKKGQLLAVIWSKEIGEKKSDLVDALSQLMQHETTYNNLKSIEKAGAIPQRSIDEMRRIVESDIIQVERLRRTLRSWRLDDAELQAVESEAQRVHQQSLKALDAAHDRTKSDSPLESDWAEVDIRAPIDGEILEVNLAVGDMVTSSDDLFKIADLSRLVVMANVYEEDLPTLKRLPDDQRTWTVKLVSQPDAPECPGEIRSIGSIIDPNQHTAVVQGWIDNSQGNLQVGQFVEALVKKPDETGLVEFSNRAIIDDGSTKFVFVALDKDLQRVQRREVRVQRRTAQKAYVPAAGPFSVKPDEQILVRGLLELSDVWTEQSGTTATPK